MSRIYGKKGRQLRRLEQLQAVKLPKKTAEVQAALEVVYYRRSPEETVLVEKYEADLVAFNMAQDELIRIHNNLNPPKPYQKRPENSQAMHEYLMAIEPYIDPY